MSKKIIGATVGSNISPQSLSEKIGFDPEVYATEEWVENGFQPKGDYLDADKLPDVIEDALEQAKVSGEFDGEDGRDGLTPTIEVDEDYTSNLGKKGVMITVKQPYANENGGVGTTIYNVPIYHGEDGKNAAIAAVNVETIDADGTPSCDVNNTILGSMLTFYLPKGEDGEAGANGKSAYEYAKDGGYTGTEAEFSAKLAEDSPSGGTSQEPLTGLTSDITPTQVQEALASGRAVIIMQVDKSFGTFCFTSFDINISLNVIYSSSILTYNNMFAVVELMGYLEQDAWLPLIINQTAMTSDLPTKVSQLDNDSGYLTTAPVTSVNGQTGAVNVAVPTKTSELTNDSGFLTGDDLPESSGGSGIHIGTEAPTDANVDVWIDTDEEAPESSGGSQADWNASEGEPGHVLNRPFYEGTQIGTLLDTTVTAQGNQFTCSETVNLTGGKTYTVIWDGTEYECVGAEIAFNGYPAVALGNPYFLGGENNGLPFLFGSITLNGACAGATATDGTHSLSISGEVYVLEKIPEKFLPEKVVVHNCTYYGDGTLGCKLTVCDYGAVERLRFFRNGHDCYMYLVQEFLGSKTFAGINLDSGKIEKVTFSVGVSQIQTSTIEEIQIATTT